MESINGVHEECAEMGKAMNDTYVEWIVARKSKPTDILIKGVSIGATVVLLVIGLMSLPFLVAGVIAGVLCYLFLPNLDLEYEYLYIDKTIQIDKIMSKQKRKRVAEYELDKMEIFAQEKAYQLDEYKNRKMTVRDYSSGDESHSRYIMILNDGETKKLILEPNEEMVKSIKNMYPRKVF